MNNNLSSSFFLEFLRKRGLYTDVKSVSPGPSTTSPTLPPLHFFQNLRQKHPESPSQRSKTFNLPFYSPAQSAVVDHGSEFKLGQSSMQSITSALQAPRPCSSISNQKLPYFCSGSASQDAVVIPTVPTQFLHLAYSSYVEGMHAVPSERILTLPIPAGDARIPPEDSVASFRTIANMPSQDNFDHQIQLPALSQREDQAKSEQILTHPGRPSEQSDEDLPFPNLIGRTERSTLDTGVPTGLNECNLCPKGFKRKHDLRRHVAVYHQNVSRIFHYVYSFYALSYNQDSH